MSAAITSFATLLELSGMAPVQWFSGRDRAAKTEILWVADSVQEARAGDLLLVPASDLTQELVKAAVKRGAAAVLALGKPSERDGFEPAQIPVAVCSEVGDFQNLHRRILRIVVNQQARLTEQELRVHAQLTQLVAEGVGLDGLVRAMEELSGQAILVQDKRLRPLASFPSPALSTIWDEVLGQLAEPERVPEQLRDRKRAGKRHAVLSQTLPGGLMRLVSPINVGGVTRGYLSLIGLEGELDLLDQAVAEQGAVVCALEMSRYKAVRETEKRLHGDLLTALLKEGLSPRDARPWAQAMGLDLNQAHVAMRFSWQADPAPSQRRLETLINGEVSRLGLTVIVSGMGSEVICFCQAPRDQRAPTAALTLGQNVLDRAIQEDAEAPVRCGVGSPASDLSRWRYSFRQAGQAMELARRLSADKPLYFPELSVYRLLLQIEHKLELQTFKDEILGPLLAYESGDEFIRTLQAYFEHNGNLSQTADAMFIHRNTLLYRMNRIQEISGLDLDNPDTRLAVQLAIHIHRMMAGGGE